MKAYYLTISSYKGIDPGAYHIYGRIRWSDKRARYGISDVDLERQHVFVNDGVSVRQSTMQFENKVSLLRKARQWFEANATPGDVMLEGSYASADPQRMLYGPPELKREANRLWRKFEELGGWENGWREVDVQAVCDAWDKLFDKAVDT